MKYNIAFGGDIAEAVFNEDWQLVAELIDGWNGHIIEHDTDKDHISGLLEHTINSESYAFVTELELIEINIHLNKQDHEHIGKFIKSRRINSCSKD